MPKTFAITAFADKNYEQMALNKFKKEVFFEIKQYLSISQSSKKSGHNYIIDYIVKLKDQIVSLKGELLQHIASTAGDAKLHNIDKGNDNNNNNNIKNNDNSISNNDNNNNNNNNSNILMIIIIIIVIKITITIAIRI